MSMERANSKYIGRERVKVCEWQVRMSTKTKWTNKMRMHTFIGPEWWTDEHEAVVALNDDVIAIWELWSL